MARIDSLFRFIRKICQELFVKDHNNNATRIVQNDIKLATVIKGWFRLATEVTQEQETATNS